MVGRYAVLRRIRLAHLACPASNFTITVQGTALGHQPIACCACSVPVGPLCLDPWMDPSTARRQPLRMPWCGKVSSFQMAKCAAGILTCSGSRPQNWYKIRESGLSCPSLLHVEALTARSHVHPHVQPAERDRRLPGTPRKYAVSSHTAPGGAIRSCSCSIEWRKLLFCEVLLGNGQKQAKRASVRLPPTRAREETTLVVETSLESSLRQDPQRPALSRTKDSD